MKWYRIKNIIIVMDNYNNINDTECSQEHFLILLNQKDDLVNEIMYYKTRLEIKEQQLKTIKKYLKDNCKHEFVSDYISSGLEETQLVEYCKHCEELK